MTRFKIIDWADDELTRTVTVSQVTDADGRTHTLNNVVTEVATQAGVLLKASGYSREADGWLDLMTGQVKSGPWLKEE